jgi:hypothetical protein
MTTGEGQYVRSYDAETHFVGGKGVALGNDGRVWLAERNGTEVMQLRADPDDPLDPHIVVGYIDGFSTPTGVAIDAAGKVWVSEFDGDRVSRIDPIAGAAGAVDMIVPLVTDSEPYNYSDMTGMVGLHTSGTGTWSVVHDGNLPNVQWDRLYWNRDIDCPQPGAPLFLEVGVRAANSPAALALNDYTLVQTSGDLLEGITGRYVQIRVRFHGSYPHPTMGFQTPVLCNLIIVPRVECLKGDVNTDGLVNGLDIQAFIDLFLSQYEQCYTTFQVAPADMDTDGNVDLDDVPCFVAKLLTGLSSCEGGRGPGGSGDCNGNGVADANDIANETSLDCNHNFIPDECDINPADPDADGLVSNDVNVNGIPDECEPDCNGNSVPDDQDIADETSNDINSNGVPDECEADCNQNSIPDSWDIAQATSVDCNANGIPDECEQDCNTNGVPDDCDVDPADPDGNEEVSPDCNGSGTPDECDFRLPPPMGSLDCNENGVPDECDLAECQDDPACGDCNGNGFPDGCDIAAEVSLDENANGIPDECEGGGDGLMGGEGQENCEQGSAGAEGTDGGGVPSRMLAWAEFHEWCDAQDWGPDADASGAEQFQAMTAKLRELGLPVQHP